MPDAGAAARRVDDGGFLEGVSLRGGSVFVEEKDEKEERGTKK